MNQLGLIGATSDTLPKKPEWAKGLSDQRHLLRWDTSQYIGDLGINGRLVHCIVDTGAHRTIIDTKMASALGLQVKKDHRPGRYSVPGSGAIHEYAGIVEGDTDIQLGAGICARVKNLRVIDHPHPFLLLGADVLSGGRQVGEWNFSGIVVETLGEGKVEAMLMFDINK